MVEQGRRTEQARADVASAIAHDRSFNQVSTPSGPIGATAGFRSESTLGEQAQRAAAGAAGVRSAIGHDFDGAGNATRATSSQLAADRAALADRQDSLAANRNPSAINNYAGTSQGYKNPSQQNLTDIKSPPDLGGVSLSRPTTRPTEVYDFTKTQIWSPELQPNIAPRPTPIATPVVHPQVVAQPQYHIPDIRSVPTPMERPSQTLSAFGGFIDSVVGGIGGFLGSIRDGVNGALSKIGGALTNFFGPDSQTIGQALSHAWGQITGQNGSFGFGDAISDAIGAIGKAIGGILGGSSGGAGGKSGSSGTSSNSNAGGSLGGSTANGRNDNYGGGRGNPVLLDLSGNGLTVDALGSSSQFLDLEGDGYLHRTAWAGKGTGVLVIDTNNDGKINQSNEFIFTEWDKSATGDLEAIRNVFDTNHNGELDAGDARWSEFKVLIDGEMKTLDQLGIASIDLTPKGSGQQFADGSAVTGTTEFTRTDGTTGTVGDAVLVNDPNGYIVKRTSTTNADGSITEDILAYNKDGSLAFRNLITRSADGNSVRTQFDDDGNGTFDRSQTDNLVIGSDGTRTRTISNLNADGSLLNRTVTITSADKKTITTTVDQDGDGRDDQSDVFVTNADGSSSTTTRAFSVDGTLIRQIKVTSSADGLTKTSETDANGDGVFELSVTETTVVNSDSSKIKTVDAKNADGSLITKTITTTSADNRSKTVKYDHSGNGTFDETETTLIEVGSNGNITTTVSSFNADAGLRDKTITLTSADGLSQTVSSDLTGDGVIDRVSSQVTIVGTDGTRTQTVIEQSGNGTLLSKSVTTTSGDGKSISVDEDRNGDGAVDIRTNIVIAADGSTTTTQSMLGPDGSLQSKTISETSAGGLSTTTRVDVNGDGVIDQIKTDVTVGNSDGSRTQTLTVTSGNGALIGKTITTTSSDSLTQTVGQDLNGDGTIDQTITNQIVLNADGSRSQTLTTRSGNGTLLSQAVTVTSADRKTTTVTTDADGDGNTDLTEVQVLGADGSKTVTSTRTNAAGTVSTGTVLAKSITTTSADGLTVTKSDDVDGNGTFDAKTTSTTVINNDGSRTTTVATTAGTTLVSKTITTTSANGLVKSATVDLDGNGVIDGRTTEVSVLNADGSKTTTTSTYAGTTLTGQTIVTGAANGLSSVARIDADGNGTIDRVVTSLRTLNADGSTRETSETKSIGGVLLANSATTRSADGKTVTVEEDGNGDGKVDTRRSLLVNANGSTTETLSSLNSDGSLKAKTVTETSSDGLTRTVRTDVDGNGTDDTITSDVTLINADGSRKQTVATRSANNTLISQSVLTTSANGLTQTLEKDTTGDGVADEVSTTTNVVNADGSRRQSVTTTSSNGTLLGNTVTLTSADRNTVTVTKDVTSDGNVDLTDIQVLNADGSKTLTSTRTNSTGALLSKTVTSTSADGLTVTKSEDFDGNGTFDAKTSSATLLNIDGSSITTVTMTNGTVVTGKTITTTSANGLIRTVETDLNGDGVVDTRSTQNSVINADGSTTRTTANYSGAKLTDKTIATSSANGLTSETNVDSDGNGTIDRVLTSVKAINADGSSTQTTETRTVAGALLAKSLASVSADGKTVTVDDDIDGDGKIDLRQVTVTNANGGVTQTVSQLKADGTLLSKSITEASASGLSKTVSTDANGDGTFDTVKSEVTVLNVDGSKTTTITETGSANALEHTVVNVSANGLTKTTQWTGSSGSMLGSSSDGTVLNADGGSVRVVSYNKADGSLESRTTTDISGDGRTTTVLRDVDGDAKTNQKEITVRNGDGSIVRTLTDYGPDGVAVSGRKTITTSANSLSETTEYDSDGNGTVDTKTVRAIVLNANGSRTETLGTYAASGGSFILKAKSVTDISANGLTKTSQWDVDGDNVLEKSQSDVTTLNADGSRTQTITRFLGSTFNRRHMITTSADGLVVTTKRDTSGSGTYDQTATDVTAVNADGTRTRTVTITQADGTVLNRSVATTSADGRTVTTQEDRAGQVSRVLKNVGNVLADGSVVNTATTSTTTGLLLDKTVTTTSTDKRKVTIERDVDGDGKVDQNEQRVQAVDGSVTTTITGLRADGTTANRTTAKVSADGLTTTTEWDLDGEGTIDRRRSTINLVNADGSQRSTISDTDETGKLLSKTIVNVSADGRTRATSKDVNGNGTVDATETVVVDASGAIVETVVNNAEAREISNLVAGQVNWAKAIAAKIETTTALDGLNRTVRYDYDGNGTYEVVMDEQTRLDGSTITTITETNADGSVKARGVMTRTADGLVTILDKDGDNNGKYEQSQAVTVRNDGSINLTTIDRNADGTLKQTTNDTFTASGKLLRELTTDGQGRKTAETLLANNGTTTASTFDAASGQTLSIARANKKGVLTTASLYDPLNANPWVRVEQTFNTDGKKISEIQYKDDGTRADVTFEAASGKDQLVNFYDASGKLTGRTTYDYGSTQSWTKIEQAFDAAGRISYQANYWDDNTRVTYTYDLTNAQTWSRIEVTYDAAGRDRYQDVYYDDGTRYLTTYDNTSTQPWSRYVAGFDTAGRVTYETYYQDNGTRNAYTYDLANVQGWTRIEQSFDTADRLTYENQYQDDGTLIAVTLDPANAQPWSRIEQFYDAARRITYQYNYNDDGTATDYSFDPANSQGWSSVTRRYNSAKQKTGETIVYDNGTHDENGWDVANTTPYSWWGVHYDAQGRRNYETYFGDDGGRDENGFDYANTSSLSWWGMHYDPQGRKTSETDFYDRGTRIEINLDPANVAGWTRLERSYDTSGRLVVDNHYNDDGTQSSVLYDTANTQPWSHIDSSVERNGVIHRNVYFDDGRHNQANIGLDNTITALWTYDANGNRISTSTAIQYTRIIFGGAPLNLNGVDLAGLAPVQLTATTTAYVSSHPVLLDLNGDDHIDLRPFDAAEFANNAGPRFDWDGDGVRDGTAWIGPQDGVLAIDLGPGSQPGGDGIIDQAREIAFASWATDDEVAENGGSVTDLEGLRLAFDSNHDNVLDDNDARWSEFRIWQDANQDGISNPGELKTMSEAGIKLINLIPSTQGATQFPDGSAITGTSSYEMTDGTTHRLVGDATLAFRSSQANGTTV